MVSVLSQVLTYFQPVKGEFQSPLYVYHDEAQQRLAALYSNGKPSHHLALASTHLTLKRTQFLIDNLWHFFCRFLSPNYPI